MSLKWTAQKSLFLSRVLVKVVMALCIALFFCVPILADFCQVLFYEEPKYIYTIIVITAYTCLTLFLGAVLFLNGILYRLNKQEVFVKKNVSAIRGISWCCFGICAFLAILGYWRHTAFLIAFIAGFFGLIFRVLKNVFQQAVELKEENDYTI